MSENNVDYGNEVVNEKINTSPDSIASENAQEFKSVNVDEKFVTFKQHVTTFRKVGNQMTSVVSQQLKNGNLVNSIVTTEVTPIDEPFLWNIPRNIKDLEKAKRKAERYKLSYHEKTNYYPPCVVQNQGRDVGDILRRMESGVNAPDNSKNLSFDEDLPFIDEHNWFKLGGRKVSDYQDFETKYQKAYKS